MLVGGVAIENLHVKMSISQGTHLAVNLYYKYLLINLACFSNSKLGTLLLLLDQGKCAASTNGVLYGLWTARASRQCPQLCIVALHAIYVGVHSIM